MNESIDAVGYYGVSYAESCEVFRVVFVKDGSYTLKEYEGLTAATDYNSRRHQLRSMGCTPFPRDMPQPTDGQTLIIIAGNEFCETLDNAGVGYIATEHLPMRIQVGSRIRAARYVTSGRECREVRRGLREAIATQVIMKRSSEPWLSQPLACLMLRVPPWSLFALGVWLTHADQTDKHRTMLRNFLDGGGVKFTGTEEDLERAAREEVALFCSRHGLS